MTVLDCIERIPFVLERIAHRREETFASLKAYLGERDVHRVVFVGSGSSYNAVHACRAFYERLGLEVQLYYPNLFYNYTRRLDDQALYVFISQGGSTRLVYESIEKVKRLGLMHCAITAEHASPIAEVSDVWIDMGCGQEEYMYRTIGFSATVAVCWQLALVLAKAEKEEIYDADYQKMIAHLPAVREQTLTYYQQHRFRLLRASAIFLAGTNDLYPIANEADIKLMEMVPLVTRSFELEEFIHGPQNCFDSSMVYLLFVRSGEDEEKAKNIARFLKAEIGYCALIGDVTLDQRDLHMDPQSVYFSALEYVTVAQVLAYCLASDKGRDLSRPLNAGMKRYVSKTIEKG